MKVRTWTDRSGLFKVEAQFIGLRDGKIHLHKLNGIKIAVPVAKMAANDLEYVEKATGVSLDEDKPLSDIRAKSQREANGVRKKESKEPKEPKAGASLQEPKPKEHDWFDFFLKCGVNPYQCDRYSQSFNKDSIDEGVLSDITSSVLRNLGLKEGDILRVMKYLDTKYGRNGTKSKLRNVSFGGEEVIGKEDGEDENAPGSGSLFAGPGGALKNNTRKGRPAPAVQTQDVVDSKVFQQKSGKSDSGPASLDSPQPPEPPSKDVKGGFDDDAWDVKPSKQSTPSSQAPNQTSTAPAAPVVTKTASPPPVKPTPTGAMADLSLLREPLRPTVTHTQSQPQVPLPQTIQPQHTIQPQQNAMLQQHAAQQNSQQQPQMQQGQPQQHGATPGFFGQLAPQTTGLPQQQPNMTGFQQPQQIGQNQLNPPRQRPQAPQYTQQGPIPPPPRPLSAPQNSGQGNFAPPPLQPQLTGAMSPPMQTGSPPPGSLNDLNRMRLQQQMGQQQQQMMPQMTGYGGQQGFMQGGFQGQLGPQQTGMGGGMLQPQVTGMLQQHSPYLLGQQAGSPFADPHVQRMQPNFTGFMPQQQQQQQPQPQQQQPNYTGMPQQQQQQQPQPQQGFNPLMPQQTGSINSVLPPPLQPQSTGLQPQATGLQPQGTGFSGVNGFNRPGFGQPPPPMPPMPSQYTQQQSAPTPPPIPQQQTAQPLQPQKTGPAPPVRFGVGPEAKKLAPQATGRRANLSQASEYLRTCCPSKYMHADSSLQRPTTRLGFRPVRSCSGLGS